MASSEWAQAKQIFDALLDAEPAEPEAWIDEHCGDDAALRDEVWSLWQAFEAGPMSGDAHGADWLDSAIAVPRSSDPAPGPAIDPGTHVGAYRLTGRLGVGGMSVVYRGERDGDDYDRTVAVKLLRQPLHADDAEQRFRAERQVLANLDHPNIARLLNGGVTEGGHPYLVMEYVDGAPITQYAEARELDLSARLDLLLQAADAVQAAHSSLVVHRDLKPSNVLVTDDDTGPEVKLLDFGIAKLLDNSLPVTRPQTRTGHHLMTPSYATPEQVTGADITAATDVYQLGVLMYEVLTGERPLDVQEEGFAELERLVVEAGPARLSEATTNTGIPASQLEGDLDTIIMKALRKEPGRRYRSVEALAADLRRYRRQEPIQARTATLGYRARKFVRRHQWGVGTTAGVLILMTVALFAVVRERNRAQTEQRKAEQVQAFLVDLFEAADPNESQGDTLTAQALLRQGRERLGQLDDEPAVRAEMMHVLGQTYRRLARYGEADTLLRQALALRRAQFGDEHPATLTSLSALALLRRDRGDYPAADTLLRTVVRIRRALRGDTHPSVIKALMYRGFVQRRRGSLGEAEASLEQALAAKRSQGTAPDMMTAELLFNRAALLRQQGRYEEALPLQQRSLHLARARTDGPHPGVAANLGNLALLHQERGDVAAADSLYRAGIRYATRLYGPEHPQVALWTGNLGSVHLEQFQYATADSLFRRALFVDRAVYEAPHPRIALHLDNLADTHSEAGQYAVADSVYRTALGMMEQVHTPPHARIANVLRDYGQLQMRTGRLDSAAAMLGRSVAMYRELGLEPSSVEPVAVLRLATVRAQQGKIAIADSLARHVLRRVRTTDSSSVRGGQALQLHGTIAREQGNWDRADSLYRAAQNAYRDAGAAEAWRMPVVQMRRGQVQMSRAHYPAAESLLARAHERLRRIRGVPDHYTKQARRGLETLDETWGRRFQTSSPDRELGGT